MYSFFVFDNYLSPTFKYFSDPRSKNSRIYVDVEKRIEKNPVQDRAIAMTTDYNICFNAADSTRGNANYIRFLRQLLSKAAITFLPFFPFLIPSTAIEPINPRMMADPVPIEKIPRASL